MDSLKATVKPDTVIVAGKQVTRIVRVPILLTDTALVDSLRRAYAGQRDYYDELIAKLKGDDKDFGWNWGSVELETKENVYADSVTTPQFFHRWYIAAEGPIKTYSYQIIPFCPPPVTITPKAPKTHFLTIGAGAQFSNELRPVYVGGYRWRFLHASVGYLPKVGNESAAVQLSAGLDI